MAAPMTRLLQKGVRFSTIATSIRQYWVKEATCHKLHTAACTHLCSRTTVDSLAKRLNSHCHIGRPLSRSFSSLASLAGTHDVTTSTVYSVSRSALLQPGATFQVQPKRTLIKYSRGRGKKKSVKAVTARFYRFNSGLWLRCRAGRNRAHWKKSKKRLKRLKQFVFCSKNQSKKLDLMVTSYWKRQKNIPDDPFAPFENRNWYGYKDYPGSMYVNSMYKREMPVNMPHKKRQF